MRSFVTLLLCCLAVGSLAASTLRTARDADDDSEEVFPSEFRSNALVDQTEERSPRVLSLQTLLITAKVAALALVTKGFISTLPIEREECEAAAGEEAEYMEEEEEEEEKAACRLKLGSRRDTIAREATQALKDIEKLMDEGAVTAVATLQGGAQGELSFAQSRYADGNSAGNDVTIISGILSGLTPGVHKLHVARQGDISNDCNNVGEAYLDESDGIFFANDKGKALVVVRAAKAPLRGADTILGRSVVITSEADPDTRKACGVIVQPSS